MAVTKIPFTLFRDKGSDDKERWLRFDLNALADFEQEVGMGLPQLMGSKAIFAGTRALLWAGLKWQERGLTIQKAGELIQAFIEKDGRLDDVLAACIEAATKQGALGRVDEEPPTPSEEKNAPKTNPATGEPGSTNS